MGVRKSIDYGRHYIVIYNCTLTDEQEEVMAEIKRRRNRHMNVEHINK